MSPSRPQNARLQPGAISQRNVFIAELIGRNRPDLRGHSKDQVGTTRVAVTTSVT